MQRRVVNTLDAQDTAKAGERTRGQLVVVGLSHHTASLELREPLALASEHWGKPSRSVPGVLLATCNRLELYSWVTGRRAGATARVGTALVKAAGLPLATFESSLFTKVGLDAIRHLVRVVSGLDFVVLGDIQIQGQVCAELRLASGNGSLSAPLNAS
jgi:glutamyl-tRNA reductase